MMSVITITRANLMFQIMAAEEMKKNVEKLDELEESLIKARDELMVGCFFPYIKIKKNLSFS